MVPWGISTLVKPEFPQIHLAELEVPSKMATERRNEHRVRHVTSGEIDRVMGIDVLD
jgi:hypothetical protein